MRRTKIILAVALALAGGFVAESQSNRNTVPGPQDYDQFTRFITDRNIFDPNRVPRYNPTTRVVRTRTRHTAGAPYVTLVGTMSYEKGLFAFFDSNNSDMKKIIGPGDTIGIYTVKEISANKVTLAGKDKKEFVMKVGEQMRQESGVWQVSEATDSGGSPAPAEATSSVPASESDSSTGSTDAQPAEPAAPSSNLEANDVLKRLMQLREKENQ
ncbi:MAG TPA: hypothetical protein VG347_02655 [Verrucomicrobiae bacterium]|nr:hypothetical protein [Verrucomicrobiae bacterium]